jgi:hypothetical protein
MLGPLISQLWVGLFDSADGMLSDMFSLAQESVDAEIEGGVHHPDPEAVAIERTVAGIRALTGG